MANTKITALTEQTSVGASDVIPIVDNSGTPTTKKITTSNLFTNTLLTTPKVTTSINDANGNEVIKTPATTSAVNELTITNAATGNHPEISATGSDSDIDLKLSAKGSGQIDFNSTWESSVQTRCRIRKSAAQSINNGSFTAVTFNQEDFDVGSMHDNATNNTRITIPANKGGIYLLISTLEFAPNATGGRSIDIFLNGSAQIAYISATGTNHDVQVLVATTIYSLSASDYIETRGYQNSGGALDINSANTRFSAFKIA